MRQLTFKGFLYKYVKELSYCRTGDIRMLAKEVPESNYRLIEPLVLYAISTDKIKYLLRVAEDSLLIAEAFRFVDMSFEDVMSLLEHELVSETGNVPYNYIKVYQSYIYFRDKQKNQCHSKMLLRNRINELRIQKNISVYRIYTDLKLNSGCIHAFIKNGKMEVIGIDTVKLVLDYIKAV